MGWRRAASLGRRHATASLAPAGASGIVLAYVVRDLDAGVALMDRALAQNANLAFAWFWSGYVKLWLGDPDCSDRALRARHAPESARSTNAEGASGNGRHSLSCWPLR